MTLDKAKEIARDALRYRIRNIEACAPLGMERITLEGMRETIKRVEAEVAPLREAIVVLS